MAQKTVMITGASRGIGLAAALALAKRGANIALISRSENELAAIAREIGEQALVVPGDVTQPIVQQQFVEKTLQRFGRIDALVNNAAVIEPITLIAHMDQAAWLQNWSVNILAPVMLIKATLPELRLNGGRVVNVSSGVSLFPVAGWGAYCSAKAALNHFTRVLAEEEPSITAVAFRPGMVDTAMQAVIRENGAKGMPAEGHSRFVQAYESGELLAPEIPGGIIAVLALHAPREWSGNFVEWNEDRVQHLMLEHGI